MNYGVAGLVAAAAMLATPGFAAAEPPTGVTVSVEVRSPILGELTVSPPEGPDTTAITVTTSAGCAAPSDGFSVLLYGPGAFATGVAVLEPTGAGFSTTSPITAALERTLAEAAAKLGASPTAGAYRLVLVCLDRTANKASGMFAGVFHLTSSTVVAPAPQGSGSGGGLSYTGAAVGALFLAGLALAAAGVAFVLITRRRAPRSDP